MSDKISIKEYLKKFSSISNKFIDNFFYTIEYLI